MQNVRGLVLKVRDIIVLGVCQGEKKDPLRSNLVSEVKQTLSSFSTFSHS